jgi:ligand-binding sensor domain-containing protein
VESENIMKERKQAETHESNAANQSAIIDPLQAGSPLPCWTRIQQPWHWRLGAALITIGFGANLIAGPEITQQPTGQIVAIGGEARFTVVAIGVEPLSYQWTRNDLLLVGATQSFLRITNAQPEAAGNYTVVITDSTGSSTNSQPRSLTVDKEWVLYNKGNSSLPYNGVVDFDIDLDGNMWISTGRWNAEAGDGLARFDGRDWAIWRTGTSALPSNDGTGMTQDADGNLWIATEKGLAKFDRVKTWTVVWPKQVWFPKFDLQGKLWVASGSGALVYHGAKWTNYTHANSPLPHDFVSYIAVDPQGRKWIATYGGGLAIFDDTKWQIYNHANSGLPHDSPGCVVFDGEGIAWVATYGGGFARFDGTNWATYDRSNSPIPNLYLWAVVIDSKGAKWISTEGGLARFQGTIWTVYNRSNSRLPDNVIYNLKLDRYENLWIGTRDGGVAVFREGGVILRPQMKSLIWDAQGRLVVRWNGGKPMYQVQSRASLDTGNWEDHGAPTDQETLSVDVSESSKFFRVTDSLP